MAILHWHLCMNFAFWSFASGAVSAQLHFKWLGLKIKALGIPADCSILVQLYVVTRTGIYKNTVNLPETSFGMRANAKQREPQIQQLWQDEQVYESLLDSNTGEAFTLHDG